MTVERVGEECFSTWYGSSEVDYYILAGKDKDVVNFKDKLGRDKSYSLLYLNAYWYDLDLRKFLTEDLAKYGINRYTYCENDPIFSTDPTGLTSEEKKLGSSEDYNPQVQQEPSTHPTQSAENSQNSGSSSNRIIGPKDDVPEWYKDWIQKGLTGKNGGWGFVLAFLAALQGDTKEEDYMYPEEFIKKYCEYRGKTSGKIHMKNMLVLEKMVRKLHWL